MNRKLTLSILLLALISCGRNDTVKTPDHKQQIDSNTERIELLEANDALQDLRLDSLEVIVANLDARLSSAENNIDANEEDILELFDLVDTLDGELGDLRDDLRREVRRLQRADRRTRRLVRNQVRQLRLRLASEIRSRRLADANLQAQIDDIEGDLGAFEARQSMFNRFLGFSLVLVNSRITILQNRLQRDIDRLDNRLDAVESDINSIQAEIASMQSTISSIQSQVDDVESRLVSVVYPCGEGSSDEVLLQTQDGLVAYYQTMRTETVTFQDSITIPEAVIPGHYDRFCVDTAFVSGNCIEYSSAFVPGTTIPSQSYSVGDSGSFQIIDKAFLAVLDDGNYRTTDGHSCNFTISNGEVQ